MNERTKSVTEVTRPRAQPLQRLAQRPARRRPVARARPPSSSTTGTLSVHARAVAPGRRRRRAPRTGTPASRGGRCTTGSACAHRWQPGRVTNVTSSTAAYDGAAHRAAADSPAARRPAASWPLLTLPVAECGSVGDELHRRRALEAGQRPGGVRDDVVGRQPGAGAQHDQRLDRLAGVGVGDAEDGRLLDVGVRQQHLLDLARVDVEAADQDQLAPPVDQVQVAVLVEVGDVAGGEPAVGVRALGAVGPVAGEDVGAADDDLARVALLDRAALLVDQPQLDARDRPADRVGLGDLAHQRRGEHRRGLGEPVALEDVVAGGVEHPVQHRRRAAAPRPTAPGARR